MNINTRYEQVDKIPCCFRNYSEDGLEKIAHKDKEWIATAIEQMIQHIREGRCDALVEIKKLQIYGMDPCSSTFQPALIEMAKLAAQRDGAGTSNNIKNYGINDSTPEGQQALIDIAKLAVRQNSRETPRYIKKYGIDKFPGGQQALIEIAKMAAQLNVGILNANIQEDYGIDITTPEGQQGLIEIVMLEAQHVGGLISEYIQDYRINPSTPEGQQGLIKIAKMAAQQDGELISEYIQNYGIDKSTAEGQKGLIEIAKLAARQMAAQQNDGNMLQYIANYGINASTPEGQQTLIEFAKQSAQQNGWITSYHIQNCGLDAMTPITQNILTKFIFNCIIQQLPTFSIHIPHLFKHFKDNLSYRSFTPFFLELEIFENVFKKLEAYDIHGALQEGLKICETHLNMPSTDLQWVQKTVPKSKDTFIQKRFLEWFFATAFLCSTTPQLIDISRREQEVFKKISKLNPHLREVLVKEIINLSLFGNIDEFKSLKAETKNTSHVVLPCLILANFPTEGETVYRATVKTLQIARIFKEGTNQKLLLETLLKIKDSSLNSLQKAALMQKLFGEPSKNILQALQIVSDLLAFKGEDELSQFTSQEDLKSSLGVLFTKKFKVNVDNFYEKYEKSIAVWRNKEAMMTYAGKLRELPSYVKEIALKFFQELFTTILNDSFYQDRYRTDVNPHLAEINNFYPNVFTKWQKSQQLSPLEMHIQEKTVLIPVAERIITTLKLALEQHHLGGDKQRDLYAFVSSCAGQWDNLEETFRKIDLELKALSGRKLEADEFEKNKSLLLQKKILVLIRNPEEMEKKIIELKSLVPKDVEFYKDIVSSIKMLKTSENEHTTSYQVIDSDDPNHFMLMGTEVLNSCQSVHGTPTLNVCLLAYFLDGKHRLGLVCDSQGIILARSVFRLLIDSKGQPVLFQERVYVADAAPEYTQWLRKLAIKKAANLGIPLVVSDKDFEKEKAQAYPHPVHAKQKPVPFEYVDALNGMQEKGYTIPNPMWIYTS